MESICFSYRQCNETDLQSILRLQEETFSLIDDPSLLRRNSPEMLRERLFEPHCTLGAFVEGELAGFAMLCFEGNTEENLSRGLVSEDMLSRCANLKLVIVSPGYRGLSLQRILLTQLEDTARERGALQLCLTVSPKNIYSLRNVEALGYERVRAESKYGGHERILYRKLL